MEARIIKLGPNTQINNVLNFNDAFDEFSNLGGKNRSKRQAKKLERIANKKERKLAKLEAKDSVKSTRKSGRLNRRSMMQTGRQELRTNKAMAKQGRRTLKKGSRLERRALGEQDNIDNEDIGVTEQTDNGYSENPNYDNQMVYGNNSDSGNYSEEENSQDNGGNYTEDNNDYSEGSNEQEYENQGSGDEFFGDENDGSGDDYEGEENYDEQNDVYNFDGIAKEEDSANEFSDGENIIDVPSSVQSVADKLEWNKEYVVRLSTAHDDILIKDPEANVDQYKEEIILKQDRMKTLAGILDSFLNFEGHFGENGEFIKVGSVANEYSDANGMTAQKKKAEMSKRRMQVAKAMGRAKKKRESVTIVKTSLNPIIEEKKIVVPAASNFSAGTGLVGLDQRDDFDAPDEIDIKLSNFSGSKDINWTGVAIGVGLGIAAIWAIKKYKLIKV